MKPRSWITLGVLVLLAAGLGVYRSLSHSASAGAGGAGGEAAAVEPGHGLPGILDFGRGECEACKKMMPVLDELARKYKGRIAVRYLDLNIPGNLERSRKLRIRLIPTQIFVDAKGNEVLRHEGYFALPDIELELEEQGWIPRR